MRSLITNISPSGGHIGVEERTLPPKGTLTISHDPSSDTLKMEELGYIKIESADKKKVSKPVERTPPKVKEVEPTVDKKPVSKKKVEPKKEE